MNLLYKNEHEGCPFYDKGDKPVIEVRQIPQADIFKDCAQQDKIIFLIEGQLAYSFGIFNACTLYARQMLFLPPNCSFTFKAVKEACVLIVRLPYKIRFCERFGIENLTYRTNTLYKTRKGIDRKMPFLLEMNDAVDAYIGNLLVYMQAGLCCRYYFETKIRELFYLFRAFYTEEELALFFCEALSVDADFSHFVLHDNHAYISISDMAAASNMTLSGFEKRFKKAFGTSACKWVNERKAMMIYHAICNETTPFKVLSDRFGFATGSSFSDFCKKNLGMTPGQIRQKCATGQK